MTGGGVNASFVYDGDGNRVKGTVAGVTTAYLGNYAEWITNATYPLIKYYYAGNTRVAMRSCTSTGSCQNHKFLFGDHLGSTSFSTDMNGNNAIYEYYYPWGEKRAGGTLPTTFQFTGQRREKDLGPAGGEGLYYYGARWYDPAVGRFVQADTRIPQLQGVQGLDRYAYTNNDPLNYTDPSGHEYCNSKYAVSEDCTWYSKIPKPISYACQIEGNYICLRTKDDPQTKITHTIFGEGGSLGPQIAANVLQTIINRAYNYWTCWDRSCIHYFINGITRIPWEKISADDLTNLLLFIISEPYIGSNGKKYPSYNAYGTAQPHPKEGDFNFELWTDIKTMVDSVLTNPGLPPDQIVVVGSSEKSYTPLNPIRTNTAVMYYASGIRENFPPPPGMVAYDTWTTIDGIEYIQYYGTQPINPP